MPLSEDAKIILMERQDLRENFKQEPSRGSTIFYTNRMNNYVQYLKEFIYGNETLETGDFENCNRDRCAGIKDASATFVKTQKLM